MCAAAALQFNKGVRLQLTIWHFSLTQNSSEVSASCSSSIQAQVQILKRVHGPLLGLLPSDKLPPVLWLVMEMRGAHSLVPWRALKRLLRAEGCVGSDDAVLLLTARPDLLFSSCWLLSKPWPHWEPGSWTIDQGPVLCVAC